MVNLFADPPQGRDGSQQLRTTGRFSIPFIVPPQGLGLKGDFILDLFPNAAAAYSLRQLRTSYQGPAIRVQRSSDDATQDIGFLENGDLDVSFMQLFVGFDDGRIVTLYDQSINGLDIIQASTTLKPKIIIGGVLQTSNLLQSIFFDGTDDFLLSTTSLTSPVSHLFIFGVWEKTNLANDGIQFNLLHPSVSPNRVSVSAPSSSGVVRWAAGNTGVDNLETAASFNDILQHVWTFTKTAGTDNQKIRRDGIELAAQTQGSTSTNLDEIILGAISALSNRAEMQFQELIFYDINKLGDVSSIEDNMTSYWQGLGSWIDDLSNEFVDDIGNNLVFSP